ncbi:MAG: S8/S53 family peptidase, partial [Roseibacillus sp.]|nr:S8/S53 family peptidase [Roseibacillus sp.]
ARVALDRELVTPGMDGLLWDDLQNGELILDIPQKDLTGAGLSADWALETLNHLPPLNGFYCYPETCRETVLYLIDTAIDPSSGFFNGNPNLEIGESILVRGTGDPPASGLGLGGYDPATAAHGTEMLSMIAGPTYGAAQGTPIKVVSYNIYPDGATTKISTLIEAINLANTHKNLNHLHDPAAFCIASSADTPGPSDASLESAIDYTLDNVYATVLVSAGNGPGSASDYTPSDLSSKKGVLCVGAIDPSNLPLQVANTRGDDGVDLWAPGEMVAAADVDGNPTAMTGTSASTALATGAALIYLSANPVLTPSQIEIAMKDSAQGSDPNQKIVYIPSPADASAANALNHMDYDDWAYWYELDLDGEHDGTDKDGDGWTDKEEYFFLGSDPTSPAGYRTPILQMVTSSQSSASFEFPLSCFLYQPSALASPFELRDGSTLSIQRSPDLVNWTDCTSEVLGLQEAGDEGLTVTISFGIAIDPMVKTKCFYRIFVYQ